MVSGGLAARDYEERLRELGHTTLEERRHQLAMQQVHRILVGKDKVKIETWFKMASDMERVTRAAADPPNLRIPAPRLEVRKNFFSQSVQESWNKIPLALKQATTAKAFRQCCGSGSGIGCLFDPWIRDPRWEKVSIRIRDPK